VAEEELGGARHGCRRSESEAKAESQLIREWNGRNHHHIKSKGSPLFENEGPLMGQAESDFVWLIGLIRALKALIELLRLRLGRRRLLGVLAAETVSRHAHRPPLSAWRLLLRRRMASYEPTRNFQLRLNPLTGDSEWLVIDKAKGADVSRHLAGGGHSALLEKNARTLRQEKKWTGVFLCCANHNVFSLISYLYHAYN
jgi:hypothetical protein